MTPSGPLDVAAVEAARARLRDAIHETADGRRFLDMTAGIAVCVLGHGHAGLAQAVAAQASRLHHTSNLYFIEAQVRLHEAGGAHQILAAAAGAPVWRWGDDLDRFIAHVQRIPLRAGGSGVPDQE